MYACTYYIYIHKDGKCVVGVGGFIMHDDMATILRVGLLLRLQIYTAVFAMSFQKLLKFVHSSKLK